MTHHFNVRLGLIVIIVLAGIVLAVYPRLTRDQTVPVRQQLEIRSANGADDSAARKAVKTDLQ